jgi:hypothetical protein
MTDLSDLGPVHAHLGTLAGGGAALAVGTALMAPGLSSSSGGTYAGQIVMAGFKNWLHRVQIAGHYCTNRAAKPHGAPARQKIWPETPEQRVLTVSADLGTRFGKISRAHRLPGYNGRYGIRERCTYARRASWTAERDHRERPRRQA